MCAFVDKRESTLTVSRIHLKMLYDPILLKCLSNNMTKKIHKISELSFMLQHTILSPIPPAILPVLVKSTLSPSTVGEIGQGICLLWQYASIFAVFVFWTVWYCLYIYWNAHPRMCCLIFFKKVVTTYPISQRVCGNCVQPGGTFSLPGPNQDLFHCNSSCRGGITNRNNSVHFHDSFDRTQWTSAR